MPEDRGNRSHRFRITHYTYDLIKIRNMSGDDAVTAFMRCIIDAHLSKIFQCGTRYRRQPHATPVRYMKGCADSNRKGSLLTSICFFKINAAHGPRSRYNSLHRRFLQPRRQQNGGVTTLVLELNSDAVFSSLSRCIWKAASGNSRQGAFVISPCFASRYSSHSQKADMSSCDERSGEE